MLRRHWGWRSMAHDELPADESRQVFHESETLKVVCVPGARTDCVFVTFDSFADIPSLPRPGFGEAFLRKHDIPAYHFIHGTNAWYQYPEMPEILARVRAAIPAGRRVITYGSSMGGYAAVRFSGLLGADVAAAFSPQFSGDIRRLRWERRWRDIARSLRFPWDDLPLDPRTEALIFYDPHDGDRRHAEMIARAMRTRLVRVPYGGHPCIALMHELKILAPTLRTIADNTFDAAACERDIAARSESSARYLTLRANALPKRAAPEALDMMRRALALCPAEPWYQIETAELLARLRRTGEAEEHFRIALAMGGHLPVVLFHWSSFLMKQDRWREALEATGQLLAISPDSAVYLKHHRHAVEGVRRALFDRTVRLPRLPARRRAFHRQLPAAHFTPAEGGTTFFAPLSRFPAGRASVRFQLAATDIRETTAFVVRVTDAADGVLGRSRVVLPPAPEADATAIRSVVAELLIPQHAEAGVLRLDAVSPAGPVTLHGADVAIWPLGTRQRTDGSRRPPEPALRAAEQVGLLTRSRAGGRFAIADRLAAEARFAEAAAACEAGLRFAPGAADRWLQFAALSRQAGAREDAEAAYAHVLRLVPGDAAAAAALAAVRTETERATTLG